MFHNIAKIKDTSVNQVFFKCRVTQIFHRQFIELERFNMIQQINMFVSDNREGR